MTLTISPAGDPWYYKRIAPTGDSTCNGVASGTTKTLTGLTPDKFHHYTAYRDSACSAAKVLDSAYFSTTNVWVGNLGEDAPSTACSIGKTFNSDTTCAVSFTTDDANTAGYALRSVTTRFNAKSGSPSNIIVAIHKADTIATAATRHRPPQSR